MKRRKFLKAGIALGATAFIGGMYSWLWEPYWLEFVRVKMPIRNLPDQLDGKILMQISDIHVGKAEFDYLKESFATAAKYEPDFVVFTGDFVQSGAHRELDKLASLLKNGPQGKYGNFGILGNHDYGYGWKHPDIGNEVSDVCEFNGVQILRNSSTESEGLQITGLDDYWGPNFAPKEILADVQKEAANLVLCHNPDVMDKDVWSGYNSWVLSGHTHGGQVKPPFLPPPILPVKNDRYTSGRFSFEDGRTLYINRAVGYIKQVRFNVRPEITIFELSKASCRSD